MMSVQVICFSIQPVMHYRYDSCTADMLNFLSDQITFLLLPA